MSPDTAPHPEAGPDRPSQPDQTAPPRRLGPQHWVLIGLIVLLFLPEAILLLADHGLIGTVRWRSLTYQYGAFWAGLLYGWQPNYPAQPVLMFLTYGVLHTGPVHLLGNVLALGWLGQRLLARIPVLTFGLIWLAAMLGGAALFGWLSRTSAPMVGASGAIFGLAAAWIITDWQDRRRALPRWAALRPALGLTLLLVVFNVGTWALQNGQLAWETHLGGFLAGGVVAGGLSWRRRV